MSAADFPNAGTIYSYFLARLTAAGGANPQAEAAGITGNLLQESGGNPESRGSGGAGLAGWTIGGRWQPGLATGNQTTDLQNQLNYVWQELTTTPAYGLQPLETQTSALGAAQTFGADYERFGIAGNRFNYAQQVYADAAAGTLPAPGAGLDIALLPPGGVGALGNEPGNFAANPGGQVSAAASGVASDAAGLFSSVLAPFESWALRMGVGLVGVVLVAAALILAAHSSDTSQAPSGPSGGLGHLLEPSGASGAEGAG